MCRHCNTRVPFLEVPEASEGTDANLRFADLPMPFEAWSTEELVAGYLRDILDQVYYDSGMKPPNYPMPAVRYAVEFCQDVEFNYDEEYTYNVTGISIVVWEAPCNLVKTWSNDLSRMREA